MNDFSYRLSGVKYGLIRNPKKNDIVSGYERALDAEKALPINKKIIIDFKNIEGLSIRALEAYNGIIEDDYLIFVIYDTIPSTSDLYDEQTFVRYATGLSIKTLDKKKAIERTIYNYFIKAITERKIDNENIIQAHAFIEKYQYDFYEEIQKKYIIW